MKKCCIVIVTHKEILDGKDEISFKRCLEIFGGKRDIKLILPDNITTTYYEEYTNVLEIIKVNNKWLSSLKEYNAMCCNQEFYELFKDYDYILIYQTDCWVFEDRLDYFMELGYDYYGAPWVHNNDMVGNGGLSLRKVSKMIEITSKYEFKGESLEGAEDTWFSITHGEEINTCPLDVAVNFSIENPTRKYLEKVNKLPMGFHGKTAMSLFWDNDGTKFINYSNRILNKKKVEKPMRILFDNQIFDLQKFGGISRMYADIKNTLNEGNEFDVFLLRRLRMNI